MVYRPSDPGVVGGGPREEERGDLSNGPYLWRTLMLKPRSQSPGLPH